MLDPNCVMGDFNNFCVRCKAGFYINTGNCLKASDQCRTFNANTGACDSCFEGFIIRNRDCVSSAVNVNEDFCELRSGFICTKCKDRYYL
jgi:proprotein convertase subtilisin/kexin type 5